jgi:hypothetical protein
VRDAFLAAYQLPQDLVDGFVAAAHELPALAIEMLRRHPRLSRVTSSWGETPIEAASHLGHRALMVELLRCGVAFDAFVAAALGDIAAVHALVNVENQDACGVHGLPLLHFGIVSRESSVFQLMVDKGVSVNPPGASLPPLHSAVATGQVSAIRTLIFFGADLQATDAFGATASDWALDLHGPRSEELALLRRWEERLEARRARADASKAGHVQRVTP